MHICSTRGRWVKIWRSVVKVTSGGAKNATFPNKTLEIISFHECECWWVFFIYGVFIINMCHGILCKEKCVFSVQLQTSMLYMFCTDFVFELSTYMYLPYHSICSMMYNLKPNNIIVNQKYFTAYTDMKWFFNSLSPGRFEWNLR